MSDRTKEAREAYLSKVAEIRRRVEGGWPGVFREDVKVLLDALDSITATAKALPAELVTAERDFYEETVDDYGFAWNRYTKSISQSEPHPSRERLYEFGESGDYDEHTVKVTVDIDAWLAVLDHMTDWAPDTDQGAAA